MRHIWCLLKDRLDTTRLSVSDEHLTKAVASNKQHQLADTLHIQLVENIVQQQYGLSTQMHTHIFKLRQFQCQQKGLLLSLRAETLDRELAYAEFKIILVRTDCRILHLCVAPAGIHKLSFKSLATFCKLCDILNRRLLAIWCIGMNQNIILLKKRHKVIQETAPLLHNRLAIAHQLLIPDSYRSFVEIIVVIELLQQTVALLQSFLIAKQ